MLNVCDRPPSSPGSQERVALTAVIVAILIWLGDAGDAERHYPQLSYNQFSMDSKVLSPHIHEWDRIVT